MAEIRHQAGNQDNTRHDHLHRPIATIKNPHHLASQTSSSIYKEANKQHWAKLQNQIKQRQMTENISYIEDEEEMTRRSIPLPPAMVFLHRQHFSKKPVVKLRFVSTPTYLFDEIKVFIKYLNSSFNHINSINIKNLIFKYNTFSGYIQRISRISCYTVCYIML
jgi:hypothetical protein